MTDLDHYQVLGVSVNVSQEDLRKAYKSLCQQYHPDRNEDNAEHFMRIRKAYDVLSDPQRKVIYDQGLRQGIKPEEFRITLGAIINKLIPLVLGRLAAHGGNFDRAAQFELTTHLSAIAGERAKIKEAQRIVTKHLKSIKSGHDSYFVQALTRKLTEINVGLQNCDVQLAVLKFLVDDTKNILCAEEEQQLPRHLIWTTSTS